MYAYSQIVPVCVALLFLFASRAKSTTKERTKRVFLPCSMFAFLFVLICFRRKMPRSPRPVVVFWGVGIFCGCMLGLGTDQVLDCGWRSRVQPHPPIRAARTHRSTRSHPVPYHAYQEDRVGDVPPEGGRGQQRPHREQPRRRRVAPVVLPARHARHVLDALVHGVEAGTAQTGEGAGRVWIARDGEKKPCESSRSISFCGGREGGQDRAETSDPTAFTRTRTCQR